jgi:hypothetical protein
MAPAPLAFVAGYETLCAFRRRHVEANLWAFEAVPERPFQMEGIASFECGPGSRVIGVRVGNVEAILSTGEGFSVPAQFFERVGASWAEFQTQLCIEWTQMHDGIGGGLPELEQLKRVGRALHCPTARPGECIQLLVEGTVGGFAAWGVAALAEQPGAQ